MGIVRFLVPDPRSGPSMTMAAVRLLAVAPALSAYLHPSAHRSRLDHTRMSAVDGESMAPLPAGLEKQVLRSGEAFRGEAEKLATLILKPKRTDDKTASLVPLVADQSYSIHKIDTRVCNQEVHRPPHAHSPAQPAHPPRPHSDPASFPPFGRCGTSRRSGRCWLVRSGGALSGGARCTA